MLSHLWRKQFGDGIIDTNIDSYAETIAIGDVSGNAFIIDYYGNVLTEYKSSMPIWGITHHHDTNGKIITATGHASKENNIGMVKIFHDDEEVASHNIESPVWDVAFSSKYKDIIATSWDGGIYIFDSYNGNLKKNYLTQGRLYGISSFKDDRLIVNSDRYGILIVDLQKEQLDDLCKIRSCSYNISYSPDSKFIVVGTHGPYIHIISENGTELCKIDGNDIFSVCSTKDLVITGARDGELIVRSIRNIEEVLYKSYQNSEIWNISIDISNQFIFLAHGDGSVSCFSIELSDEKLNIINYYVENIKNNKEVDFEELLSLGIDSSVIYQRFLQYIHNKLLGLEDLHKIRVFLVENRMSSGSNEGDEFLKSTIDYFLEDYESAIEGLQSISPANPNYSLAIMFLVRSFIALDNYESARQFLVTNLEILDRRFVPEALEILSSINNSREKSLSIYQNLGITSRKSNINLEVYDINRSKLSLEDDYTRDIILKMNNNEVIKDHDKQSLDYGAINYIKYEYANRADTVKKILEKNTVEEFLNSVVFPRSGKPISLDIGCATCRYPLWFSEIGFYAVGYDVDDDAIKICKNVSKGKENIEIHKKNVLDSPIEENKYSIITCMMGTFNHIPKEDHLKFVNWIYESLRIGGSFIFSSWNIECPYTTYLYFYNREARENIINNCRPAKEVEFLLKESGFRVSSMIPICFLPDECYEAWMGEMKEDQIIEVDNFLGSMLRSRNSQMFVVKATKV